MKKASFNSWLNSLSTAYLLGDLNFHHPLAAERVAHLRRA